MCLNSFLLIIIFIWILRFAESILVSFLLMYYAIKGFISFTKNDKRLLIRSILILIVSIAFLFYTMVFFFMAFSTREYGKLIWLINELVPVVLAVLSLIKTIQLHKDESCSKRKYITFLITTIILFSIVALELILIPVGLILGYF